MNRELIDGQGMIVVEVSTDRILLHANGGPCGDCARLSPDQADAFANKLHAMAEELRVELRRSANQKAVRNVIDGQDNWLGGDN